MIDLIDLTLWNIDRQHSVLVNVPLESLSSCRRPAGRPEQCNGVSLLNGKRHATPVDDNQSIGRFVERDDTERFRRR